MPDDMMVHMQRFGPQTGNASTGQYPPVPPSNPTPLRLALERLDQQVSMVEQVLVTHAQTLEPLLRQVPSPADRPHDQGPSSGEAQVVLEIDHIVLRLQTCCLLVQNLHERLCV